MYSLWILAAALAFWVVRMDNLTYLLGAIFDTARFPVEGFEHGTIARRSVELG